MSIDFHIQVNPMAGREELLPAEAIVYAARAGYRAVGLVVRSDGLAMEALADWTRAVEDLGLYANLLILLGVELVHVPPALLPGAVERVRAAGVKLVLAHGESLAGPVEQGSNFAAVEAGVDILAHPGLVDAPTARYAAERGVALEFSACPEHAFTNAHVARMAREYGCALVPGSNARRADALIPAAFWKNLFRGAALDDAMVSKIGSDAQNLVQRLSGLGGRPTASPGAAG